LGSFLRLRLDDSPFSRPDVPRGFFPFACVRDVAPTPEARSKQINADSLTVQIIFDRGLFRVRTDAIWSLWRLLVHPVDNMVPFNAFKLWRLSHHALGTHT